jgi:hypothetical protein
MPETQVLFLHHLDDHNQRVVESNFESFARHGNDILGIRDEDVRGLPNSCPVSINGKIPRGSRRWATDVVLLNYVLDNRDRMTHNYYMFCEYDCYCECNIDSYCEPYREFDVCSPYLVTKKNEGGWGWFNSLNIKCEPIGLRPSTFVLFSKEALIAIAEKYVDLWGLMCDSNSEARLGSVASLIGLKIGQFKDLHFRASWGPARFQRNMTLYHPVKHLVSDKTFLPPMETLNFAGAWEFGRYGEPKMGTLVLQADGTISGYDNYNEAYWHESGDTISIYSGRGGLTSRFKNVVVDGGVCIGDYYHGDIHEEKMHTERCHWIRRIKL